MEYSFPRYLLAKQSVDDRALNKDVLCAGARCAANSPRYRLPLPPPRCASSKRAQASGTMLTRLLRWNVLPPDTDYTLVDEMPENIALARAWLPAWAQEHGWRVERPSEDHLRLSSASSSVSIRLAQADVFDFIRASVSSSASHPFPHPLHPLLHPLPHPFPHPLHPLLHPLHPFHPFPHPLPHPLPHPPTCSSPMRSSTCCPCQKACRRCSPRCGQAAWPG